METRAGAEGAFVCFDVSSERIGSSMEGDVSPPMRNNPVTIPAAKKKAKQ